MDTVIGRPAKKILQVSSNLQFTFWFQLLFTFAWSRARAVLVFILLIVTIKGSTMCKNLVMTNQIKYEKLPCQIIEKHRKLRNPFYMIIFEYPWTLQYLSCVQHWLNCCFGMLTFWLPKVVFFPWKQQTQF